MALIILLLRGIIIETETQVSPEVSSVAFRNGFNRFEALLFFLFHQQLNRGGFDQEDIEQLLLLQTVGGIDQA